MLLYESLGHNEKLHQDIDLEGQEAEQLVFEASQPKALRF